MFESAMKGEVISHSLVIYQYLRKIGVFLDYFLKHLLSSLQSKFQLKILNDITEIYKSKKGKASPPPKETQTTSTTNSRKKS
jgi:hypothetical protein